MANTNIVVVVATPTRRQGHYSWVSWFFVTILAGKHFHLFIYYIALALLAHVASWLARRYANTMVRGSNPDLNRLLIFMALNIRDW